MDSTIPNKGNRCPQRICATCVMLAMMLIVDTDLRAQSGLMKFPPIPPEQTFINDYANVITPADANEIGHLQQLAFEKHDMPIIVVTITSMSRYANRKHSIKDFATRWFNQWEIGKRDANGDLVNRGILLLVSIGDRKARIELGAEWGRRWDKHCQIIMDQAIIPAFKRSDYSAGIREGVRAMQTMIERGPNDQPPANFADDLTSLLKSKPLPMNPVPLWGMITMALMGIGLIVLSFRMKGDELRHHVLAAGLFMLAGAFFFWFIIAFLSILLGRLDSDNDGDMFGGGGFSGGGFGGGGFSGGGGATGSW